MLGLYVHRDSLVHAAPAGGKLLLLFGAAAVVLLSRSPWLLGGALAGSALLFALARLPLRAVVEQVRPLLVIALAFFAVQAAFDSVAAGLVTVGRFLVLVLLATLVTLTTRVSDMVETLERALACLRPLGVNAGKVSLMLALTIRLVPVLLAQAQEIRMAQRARGVERSAVALLVPLMVKTLRMADDLADALEARGYDPK
jgi:biotin transport system permease protein